MRKHQPPSSTHINWLRYLSAILFTLFVSISCQKENLPLQTENISRQENDLVSPPKDNLTGLSDLWNISLISNEIKNALDLKKYKYFENRETGKLWVIALKKGSFGLAKAKIFVSSNKGEVSIKFLSYVYDESTYVTNDWNTYTGTISIHDAELKKLRDLVYKQGKLQRNIPADCINCSLCYGCPPPSVNWCQYFPSLCSSSGGGGVGGPGENQELLPPDEGGGGPSYSATVEYLTSVLNLTPMYSYWLHVNPMIAEDLKNLLVEDDLSEEAKVAAKITISIGSNPNPYSLTKPEISNLFAPYFYNTNYSIDLYGIWFTIQCALVKAEHPDWPWWKVAYHAAKETIHILLDGGGLIPFVGEIFDLANATLYLIDGDGLNASLSAASAIPFVGWYAQGIKYAKKTITALDNSSRTLKWLVKNNNIIDFGDRNLLRKVLGIPKGDPRIAHHMIPWEHGADNLVQKAAQGNALGTDAFHLNEILNGIPLSTIQHSSGSHWLYNEKVRNKLQSLWNTNGQGAMSPETAAALVRGLANDIRSWILTHPNESINNIVL